MARVKPEDITFEIVEYLGSLRESDKHDWCKAVARISWNNNPASLDIRSLNLSTNKIGKGIGLSDEEADRLVDILLENDFGTLDVLEETITRKRNRFTISQDAANSCFDDKYIISINMGDD